MIKNILEDILARMPLYAKNADGLSFREEREADKETIVQTAYTAFIQTINREIEVRPYGANRRVGEENGEWAIIHRCKICGKISSNRVAADDNPMKLMALALRPFGSQTISQNDIKNMTITMEG